MAKKGQKGPRPKHIPQRTCIACRQEKPKRELVRVVRTLAGPIEVDLTGKQAGRGAYICPNRRCWELAFKKKALEHALETTITEENKAALQTYATTLPQAAVESPAPTTPEAEVRRA